MANHAPRAGRVQAAEGARRAGLSAWTRAEHGVTICSRRPERFEARSAGVPASIPGAASALVGRVFFTYSDCMYATAIVNGKVVRFRLSPALARAHRENRGKSVTEPEAVTFVEMKRSARSKRRTGRRSVRRS